jgi:hypothetical protein
MRFGSKRTISRAHSRSTTSPGTNCPITAGKASWFGDHVRRPGCVDRRYAASGVGPPRATTSASCGCSTGGGAA